MEEDQLKLFGETRAEGFELIGTFIRYGRRI